MPVNFRKPLQDSTSYCPGNDGIIVTTGSHGILPLCFSDVSCAVVQLAESCFQARSAGNDGEAPGSTYCNLQAPGDCTVIKSFKVMGISNSVVNMEDDQLWEGANEANSSNREGSRRKLNTSVHSRPLLHSSA